MTAKPFRANSSGAVRCTLCRSDGTPAQVGDNMRVDERGFVHFEPPYIGIDFGSEPGFSVPNRLFGTEINQDGDAV